jgi:hypothetical protein
MNKSLRSFDAGYYQLKTARQKKRLLRKDRDKQLLRLDRRQNELYLLRRALPMIPLAEPYQRGWKRTFVLREDVARSGKANFYAALLPKINTTMYSPDKSFKRKSKRRKNRKRQYEERQQLLREFYTREWMHNCKLSPEEKAHFYPKECRSRDGKTMTIKYVFAEPWRFVLRISPRMITHAKMHDEVLEQEIRQVANYIDKHHLSPRIMKLTRGQSWRSYWSAENGKYKNPFKNKPLYRILEEADCEE